MRNDHININVTDTMCWVPF